VAELCTAYLTGWLVCLPPQLVNNFPPKRKIFDPALVVAPSTSYATRIGTAIICYAAYEYDI